jgi:hypothetical protein
MRIQRGVRGGRTGARARGATPAAHCAEQNERTTPPAICTCGVRNGVAPPHCAQRWEDTESAARASTIAHAIIKFRANFARAQFSAVGAQYLGAEGTAPSENRRLCADLVTPRDHPTNATRSRRARPKRRRDHAVFA